MREGIGLGYIAGMLGILNINIIFEVVDTLPDLLKLLLMILGAIYIFNLILRWLMRTFETVERFVRYIELRTYYPLASRLVKRKHKEYVKERLRDLISRKPVAPSIGIEYDIDVEWSGEEEILLDLERGVLLIRIPYTTNLIQVIAKILLMASPYAVSQYLEPVFGHKLARLLSSSIAREYASRDANILREFMQYIREIYEGDEELRDLIDHISRADDESLYKHIVLYELKKVLEEYDGHIDRDRLESGLKSLIRTVGSLSNISEPTVCSDYISIAIVRVGRLEKVLFEEWNSYINYMTSQMKKCGALRRIYVVSAGRVIRRMAKRFIGHVISNVGGLKLLNEISYRARRYRGRPGVTSYIAVLEIE